MPIYLGNTQINAEYVDSYGLSNIYLGDNLVQGNFTPEVTTNGLVAYYDINNINSYPNSGDTVYDLTANDNDISGANYFTASFKQPSFSSAYLEVNDGYLFKTAGNNLPTSSTVNAAESQPSFTIGYWAKWGKYGTEVAPNNAFSIGSSGFASFTRTNLTSSTKLTFGYSNNTNYPFTLDAVSTYNLNSWYNVIVTYSGSTDVYNSPGFAKIYVNGQLINSGSLTISIANGNDCPITIGTPSGLSPSQRGTGFSGSFAVGYVYNRELSPKEVLYNYQAQKSEFGY
jgi:hypothetical protein